jgi:hypothetical protein
MFYAEDRIRLRHAMLGGRAARGPLPLRLRGHEGRDSVTDRVALEALVRFLVDDLDVVPLRDDWREIVERGEEAFHQTRTWA